jgi:hypothetical protein
MESQLSLREQLISQPVPLLQAYFHKHILPKFEVATSQ